MLKKIVLGLAAVTPFAVFLFNKDKQEHTLPSLIHEELSNAGIDFEKVEAGLISDAELIKKGFNPVELNHWMYGKKHPKYRRE